MIERVRAVLLTPTDEILLLRRDRPGIPTYWVLPGGHVEPTDASREQALRREVHEELAGIPQIHSLIQIINSTDDRQYIYLARVTNWSFTDRSGLEFTEAGRGSYELDLIPNSSAAIAAINLKPDALAQLLVKVLDDPGALFALPDLRATGRLAARPAST